MMMHVTVRDKINFIFMHKKVGPKFKFAMFVYFANMFKIHILLEGSHFVLVGSNQGKLWLIFGTLKVQNVRKKKRAAYHCCIH